MVTQASRKPANDPGNQAPGDGHAFKFDYSAHHANGQPRTTVSSSLGRQFWEALFKQFAPITKFTAYGLLMSLAVTGILRISHQWHTNSMQRDLQHSAEDLRLKCFGLSKWHLTKDCLATVSVPPSDLTIGEVANAQ